MGVNQLYDTARERMLKASLDWANLNLLAFAFTSNPDTAYNPAHLTVADVGLSYAVSQPMLSKVVMPGGYARTSAANFPNIAMGSNITFFVIAEAATPATASKLIIFLSDVEGLPFIPNGLGYLLKPDWLFSQGWFRA